MTVVMLAVVGALALWIVNLGPAPLGEGLDFSATVVDRDGRLLRPYATPEGRWRLPARADGVDPRYLALLIAVEDRRFRDHAGVDPLAFVRAAGQMASHGRIVSGGSTLTMQVARLLEPRAERSVGAKLRQIVRAVEIERHLGKDDILSLYLNLAPYGGNLEGIRAASLAYFGKEPRRLTLAESALLVALPQAPEARRPDRFAAAARRARDRVLDRAVSAGVFDTVEVERAKAEPIPSARTPMPMLAPHAAEEAVVALTPEALASSPVVRLTIDARWQASLEELARERARALGPNVSVAILAVDHGSGEVLARVGSADYFDAGRAGQVDMTAALRSPGSTLKPFIYGLGFEDGVIHPETLIDDRPVRYGSYAPENFDLTFQGTVSVRKALQMSLNVPAVAVLDRVGAGRFTARLRQAGGALVLPAGEIPGLAMGLGGVGVRLSDLVMLYAGIARLGATAPLVERADALGSGSVPPEGARDARPPESRRLMEPVCGGVVRRRHPARHAAARKRPGRAHRLQDRDELRLPRRVVGRLRRQAHGRRVGGPSRRRAGAWDHRTHRCGADPVRRLRALRPAARAAAGAAARRRVREQR
jgi:penicillin-binding protein 1C